jgi:hypothetical protein
MSPKSISAATSAVIVSGASMVALALAVSVAEVAAVEKKPADNAATPVASNSLLLVMIGTPISKNYIYIFLFHFLILNNPLLFSIEVNLYYSTIFLIYFNYLIDKSDIFSTPC